ncbi:MAG: phosphoglycerate mutase family protein [Thermodesulfobacteriota bacterium]
MRLYLVRHAEAVERSGAVLETHRFLTAKGRLAFRDISRRVRELGASPEIIFSSPLVRAVQTAEILSERLKYRGEIVVAPELSPGFDHRALRSLLAAAGHPREAAFVGHEPDLGELAAFLLSPAVEEFPLRKGAVLGLEAEDVSEGSGRFLWRADGKGTVQRLSEAMEN